MAGGECKRVRDVHLGDAGAEGLYGEKSWHTPTLNIFLK